MTDLASAPIFASRYRFEAVGDDWDTGRSGFTHLVYDLKEKRLGVIKRAEVSSTQAVEGLKNEVAALNLLVGLGVPEVYDTGTATHGSKKFFYMVMEFIDAVRVEAHLDSFSAFQRAEILTKFLWLLALAHSKGITNGDIDIKHLFWRGDKRQLVMIDWGNAKLGIDTKDKTKFSWDLARAGEIIFSLVTCQGQPQPTGSIALPASSGLLSGLSPLPHEFYELCKWAPRTPTDNALAPYTAQSLFEISKQWLQDFNNANLHKPASPKKRHLISVEVPFLRIMVVLVVVVLAYFVLPKLFFTHVVSGTPTTFPIVPGETQSLDPTNSAVPAETLSQVATPTKTALESTTTPTSTQIVIPPPQTIKDEIVIFDNNVTSNSFPSRLCWREDILPTKIKEREGFFRKGDYDWWIFIAGDERELETPVQANLYPCVSGETIGAMALNALVTRLEPEREGIRAREFGIFLEDENENRREYTLWIDKDSKMHLRIFENGIITGDNIISIVTLANLQRDGNPPNDFYKFPIQMFLEVDNQGLDIIYLQEQNLPYRAIKTLDFKSDQMIRIDYAIRPTLGKIQKVGLLGRGGETQVLIWPLSFSGR